MDKILILSNPDEYVTLSLILRWDTSTDLPKIWGCLMFIFHFSVSNAMVTGSNPAEDIVIGFVLSYPVITETLQYCHVICSWKLSGTLEEQRLP
jgi:hypothetical protein